MVATWILSIALTVTAYGASSVSLTWTANSDSDLGGYRLHYGTASGEYTQHLDVGNVTTATLYGLTNNTTYFVILTAYNVAGIESQPSNQISFVTSNVASSPTPTPGPTATPNPTVTPHPTATPHATPHPSATPGHTPAPTPPGSTPPGSTPHSPTPTPAPGSRKTLLNVATRTFVQKGEDVMIGGFIISGTKSKKVIVRALGPSLAQAHVAGAMANPTLKLYSAKGNLVGSNDDWTTRRSEIMATGIPPIDSRESALVATLRPGNYTCMVESKTGVSGVALFELYDLDAASSRLINVSTRGKTGTGDRVVIGGFIVGGDQPTKVLIRAIGPSLAKSGISDVLADPKLELHGPTGSLIFANDNWRGTQQQAITASGIAPTDNRESAIIATLTPGRYTAIVRGAGNSTGVALVEVYNLEK